MYNLILLTNYSSGGEAMFVGLLQGLLIFGVIAIWSAIRKKKKKFEDTDNDDKN